jgi:hypothetical protein
MLASESPRFVSLLLLGRIAIREEIHFGHLEESISSKGLFKGASYHLPTTGALTFHVKLYRNFLVKSLERSSRASAPWCRASAAAAVLVRHVGAMTTRLDALRAIPDRQT